MALFHLGPAWEKIAESTDDRFTAQCQGGYGMRVAFGAEPDASVLGLLVVVGGGGYAPTWKWGRLCSRC